MVSVPLSLVNIKLTTIDGWAFLLAFTAPMWALTGCALFGPSPSIAQFTFLNLLR